MAKGDRLIAAARARVILPAAGAAYGAAEVMHQAHVAPVPVVIGTAVTAAAAYRTRARPLTGSIAAAGVWVTTATAYGPLAGHRWWYPLTLTWAAAALAAVRAAARHPSVRDAKAWRAAKREFNTDAHTLGLRGAHMIKLEDTRLGERWTLDITGTGRRASQIVHSGLAEVIAMHRDLAKSRVRVTEGRLAKHVIVSIRELDPWEHPIPHPLFDEDPEIDLPFPCTITEPFPVGQDPETGDPLLITLWDEVGGKVILVIGKRGAGKDVLLDCIRERVTAAYDADLWEINVSKAQNERAWAQACEYAACGPEEAKKAAQILLQARLIGDERGHAHRDKTTLRPDRNNRLKVLLVNETDALFQLPNIDPAFVKKELRYITSKLRSEGFALVLASQRAVFNWIGGTDVKANIDYACVGKVQSPQEVNNAVGRLVGAMLPDMSTYGEGKPGVWCVVADGGDYQLGRTFEMPPRGDLNVLRELARERAFGAPVLVGAGSHTETLPASNLLAGNHSPGGDEKITPAGLEDTARDILRVTGGDGPPRGADPFPQWEAAMPELPEDLRAQLGRAEAKQSETKRILDATPDAATLPKVDQETRAAANAGKWRQLAEQTVIPADARAKLLAMIAGDGMSTRKITEGFAGIGVKRWKIIEWLNRLRYEGLAKPEGRGAAAKWVRVNGDGP